MNKANENGKNIYWIDDPKLGSFEIVKENQNLYINNDGHSQLLLSPLHDHILIKN